MRMCNSATVEEANRIGSRKDIWRNIGPLWLVPWTPGRLKIGKEREPESIRERLDKNGCFRRPTCEVLKN
jgi:hypothetical protein